MTVLHAPRPSSAAVDPDGPTLTVLVVVSERPVGPAQFFKEYIEKLGADGRPVQIVFAVEHWLPRLADEAVALAATDPRVTVLLASQPMSETGLIRMAFPHCQASEIVILSAHRRIEPAGLPAVIAGLADADLVVARRWPRRDSWVNRVQGRVFHRLVSAVSPGGFTDLGSGVRAMRRRVLEEIPMYGESYRFLPILALRDGLRVREVDCPQHDDDRRTRFHGPGVYVRRALDLLGLYFLVRFTEKPLRFFGLVGGATALAGIAVLLLIVVERIGGLAAGDRPLLLLGVLLSVLGAQAIALGLVGEIIVHLHAARFRRYRLAEPPREQR